MPDSAWYAVSLSREDLQSCARAARDLYDRLQQLLAEHPQPTVDNIALVTPAIGRFGLWAYEHGFQLALAAMLGRMVLDQLNEHDPAALQSAAAHARGRVLEVVGGQTRTPIPRDELEQCTHEVLRLVQQFDATRNEPLELEAATALEDVGWWAHQWAVGLTTEAVAFRALLDELEHRCPDLLAAATSDARAKLKAAFEDDPDVRRQGPNR